MKNKYFVGISNTENIFWVRLKPQIEVIEKINTIVKSLNTDFSEAIFSPDDNNRKYENFYPRRYTHQHNFYAYAISIFNENLIDFIILKDSPIYDKVFELYQKEFQE